MIIIDTRGLKRYFRVSVFLLLGVLCFIAVKGVDTGEPQVFSYSLANKVIVVDAGHGGKDPGAVRGTYVEKDIVLELSKKLEQHLAQAGALVVMVREDDKDLAGESFQGTYAKWYKESAKKRIEFINNSEAKMCISIHTNADPSPNWSGAQVFYNQNSEQSKLLAVCIQEELTRILGNTNRKAKPGNYYILSRTEMPAVIVEVGFISNPKEAKNLVDAEYQNKLTFAISSGIAQAGVRKYDDEIADYPGYD